MVDYLSKTLLESRNLDVRVELSNIGANWARHTSFITCKARWQCLNTDRIIAALIKAKGSCSSCNYGLLYEVDLVRKVRSYCRPATVALSSMMVGVDDAGLEVVV